MPYLCSYKSREAQARAKLQCAGAAYHDVGLSRQVVRQELRRGPHDLPSEVIVGCKVRQTPYQQE